MLLCQVPKAFYPQIQFPVFMRNNEGIIKCDYTWASFDRQLSAQASAFGNKKCEPGWAAFWGYGTRNFKVKTSDDKRSMVVKVKLAVKSINNAKCNQATYKTDESPPASKRFLFLFAVHSHGVDNGAGENDKKRIWIKIRRSRESEARNAHRLNVIFRQFCCIYLLLPVFKV